MIEYALIELESNTVLQRRQFDDTPPDISHKGLRWLPLTIIRPALDITQYVELDPVTEVTETSVTITYPQRHLTVEEQTAARLHNIEVSLFDVNPYLGNVLLYLYNQTRSQQGLAEASKEQFIAFADSLLNKPDMDPAP